ncbi:MAG TPA: hypothetical protein VJT67_05810 [Longimicrobiaceae bacterium]|nr:hypothetical protein [Longimicrobiaceae bacterium]
MTKAVAAALLLLAAPAAAQNIDQGTFTVSVDGHEVGTEQFTITQSGSGTVAVTMASGRVDLRLPSGSLQLAPRLRAQGVGADPVQYQVDVSGDAPQRVVGTIGGGRVSAKIVTSAGEQLREYVASAGAVVLDEGVAHHYYFLATRTHAGRVPVIVPRENRQVMATVTSRGEEPVQIAGRSVRLFHLNVAPQGGDPADVWVDDLNRVIKVEVPARQYLAVRTALPR